MVVNETLSSVAACCHLTMSSSLVNGSAALESQHVLDANGSSSVGEWVLTELTTTLVNGTLLDNGSFFEEWSNETNNQVGVAKASGGYWALILVLFPIFTVFGNVLVILSVYKEKYLRSVTNYFIVSLAVADLLVAALVMPFAVYVLVNGDWELSSTLCDFYIAMDVICSTSSIFNLVAISIDRFIAITQPIKYSEHKTNYKRGYITIALVWVISAAIGFPIVLGLNTAPDKNPLLCVFYNTDFIIYSSLSSFYIPCIIMVYLYYCIFRTLYRMAAAQKKKLKTVSSKPGTVIENKAQTEKLQETSLLTVTVQQNQSLISEQTNVPLPDPPTDNPTDSGSHEDEEEEEDEEHGTPASEDCQVIPNDKSTEFMLTPVKEGSSPKEIQGGPATLSGYKHCNNDSDYAPSTKEETSTQTRKVSLSERTPNQQPLLVLQVPTTAHVLPVEPSPPQCIDQVNTSKRNGRATPVIERSPSGRHKKGRKSAMKSRFPLPRGLHKSSYKKREKSSAKKEKRATQTLAIVLGVFLICWVPFFTCNIMDALCTKLRLESCQPSITTFLLTTWLGYMNSFINPVIYTIFNLDFRKAFKKILTGR